MMSMRRAPSALRRPISRVRSVTETSMIFMMPMPPTSSEMAAMPPRKMVKTPVMVSAVFRKSCWVRMVKSSSPMAVRWRVRRIWAISSLRQGYRASIDGLDGQQVDLVAV